MNLPYFTRFGRRQADLPAGQAGFTLIELLVVIGIITVVSAVILANNNKFGGQALLQNLAYDIALSVREAQVYGISVKQNSAGAFSSGYGMYFALATPGTYHLFADVAQSGVYAAHEDVSPSPYVIGRGFYISKLCVTPASGVENCTPTTLDIIFIRPEPDAWINPTCSAGSNGNETCTSLYTRARVVMTSPRGDVMSVVVYSNGQISVDNLN
jgi:prepilin-type N-terminal cleavage/methylation domain-containing protein